MQIDWTVDTEVSHAEILAPTDASGLTPITSSAFDMRTLPPGSRIFLILSADVSLTGAIAHGVTFSVNDTTVEADGTPEDTGWAAAKTHGSLAKLTALGELGVSVEVAPGGLRPFLQVVATGDDAATLYSVSARLIALPREL